jgi:hypothetical protein
MTAMTDEKSPRADLSAFDAATIERARVAVREYMDWISDTGGDETGKLSPFAQDALVHQFAWYLSRRSPPSGYRLVPVEPTEAMVVEGLAAFVGSVKSTWGDPAAQEKGSIAHSMAIGQTLHSGTEVRAAYRAMLAAAPSPKEGK